MSAESQALSDGLGALEWVASASTDGSARLWPHGAWLLGEHVKDGGGTSRAISSLDFCAERQLVVTKRPAIGAHALADMRALQATHRNLLRKESVR